MSLFACCIWFLFSPKKWSGWRLCRRPPLDGSKLKMVGMVLYPSQNGEEEIDSETDSDASDFSDMTGNHDRHHDHDHDIVYC